MTTELDYISTLQSSFHVLSGACVIGTTQPIPGCYSIFSHDQRALFQGI